MEHTSNTSLFSLSIDPITKAHLGEAAKWARFLAILGMIFLVLIIFVGVFGSTILFSSMNSFEGDDTGVAAYGSGIFAGYMIVAAVIYFFPLLFTLRFANNLRSALNTNNQQALNTAFQNLKACFRFIGILTIIGLVFTAIGIIVGIMSAAAFG